MSQSRTSSPWCQEANKLLDMKVNDYLVHIRSCFTKIKSMRSDWWGQVSCNGAYGSKSMSMTSSSLSNSRPQIPASLLCQTSSRCWLSFEFLRDELQRSTDKANVICHSRCLIPSFLWTVEQPSDGTDLMWKQCVGCSTTHLLSCNQLPWVLEVEEPWKQRLYRLHKTNYLPQISFWNFPSFPTHYLRSQDSEARRRGRASVWLPFQIITTTAI